MSASAETEEIKKIRSQKGLERILSEYEFIKKKKGLHKIGGSIGIINKENGNDKDYYHWKACFIGLDDKYPESKPLARFRTRVYHPNVNWCSGQICLDYIKGNWTSNNTLREAILSIFNLLKNPVFNSVLNGDTSKDSKEAPDFKEKARNYRAQYAYQSQKYNWNENYTNWTASSFPTIFN